MAKKLIDHLKTSRLIILPKLGPARPKWEDGTRFTQPHTPLTVQEPTSAGGVRKQQTVAPGQSAKVHRNFQGLAWYPGAISEVQFDGIDVLTGPMSGCWVIVYRHNGVERVAHIGTSENTGQSRTVKEAWNQFAHGRAADMIAGFQPNRSWQKDERRKTGDGNQFLAAVVQAEGPVLYSVMLYATLNPPPDLQFGHKQFRIAGHKKVTTADPQTLCNIPI